MTRFLCLLAATSLSGLALAQIAPREYGVLNFQSTLGSFRLVDSGGKLAEGKVTIEFTGTLLVSGLEGKLDVSGNLKKEYDGSGRKVYFGTGKAVIDGKFRAVQLFGRNMKGVWNGVGVAMFYGEFDRNLKTGEFWFNDPKDRENWGTGGRTVVLPQQSNKPVAPVDRANRKSGGG